MKDRQIYLYNTEIYEIGFALGEEEKQERFVSQRCGWIEISNGEYYRIRDAVNHARTLFVSNINNML